MTQGQVSFNLNYLVYNNNNNNNNFIIIYTKKKNIRLPRK